MSLIDFDSTSVDRSSAGFIARRIATSRLGESEIANLSREPFAHAESILGIDVRKDARLEPSADCAVPATYDPLSDPPTIRIRLSGSDARDNFSLLHEIAHHLLHADEEWGYEIAPRLGLASRRHEDAVANYFAGLLLVTDEDIGRAIPNMNNITGASLRQLFRETSASRSAVLSRLAALPIGDQVLGFSKLDGEVQGARARGDIPPPGARSVQPALQELATRATHGNEDRAAIGSAHFVYSNGRTFNDLSLDGAIDGEFLFFVGKEAHLLRGSSYDDGEPFECPSCGREAGATRALPACSRCGENICPHCGRCSCRVEDSLCTECGTVLSLSDVARGDGRCEFC